MAVDDDTMVSEIPSIENLLTDGYIDNEMLFDDEIPDLFKTLPLFEDILLENEEPTNEMVDDNELLSISETELISQNIQNEIMEELCNKISFDDQETSEKIPLLKYVSSGITENSTNEMVIDDYLSKTLDFEILSFIENEPSIEKIVDDELSKVSENTFDNNAQLEIPELLNHEMIFDDKLLEILETMPLANNFPFEVKENPKYEITNDDEFPKVSETLPKEPANEKIVDDGSSKVSENIIIDKNVQLEIRELVNNEMIVDIELPKNLEIIQNVSNYPFEIKQNSKYEITNGDELPKVLVTIPSIKKIPKIQDLEKDNNKIPIPLAKNIPLKIKTDETNKLIKKPNIIIHSNIEVARTTKQFLLNKYGAQYKKIEPDANGKILLPPTDKNSKLKRNGQQSLLKCSNKTNGFQILKPPNKLEKLNPVGSFKLVKNNNILVKSKKFIILKSGEIVNLVSPTHLKTNQPRASCNKFSKSAETIDKEIKQKIINAKRNTPNLSMKYSHPAGKSILKGSQSNLNLENTVDNMNIPTRETEKKSQIPSKPGTSKQIIIKKKRLAGISNRHNEDKSNQQKIAAMNKRFLENIVNLKNIDEPAFTKQNTVPLKTFQNRKKNPQISLLLRNAKLLPSSSTPALQNMKNIQNEIDASPVSLRKSSDKAFEGINMVENSTILNDSTNLLVDSENATKKTTERKQKKDSTIQKKNTCSSGKGEDKVNTNKTCRIHKPYLRKTGIYDELVKKYKGNKYPLLLPKDSPPPPPKDNNLPEPKSPKSRQNIFNQMMGRCRLILPKPKFDVSRKSLTSQDEKITQL